MDRGKCRSKEFGLNKRAECIDINLRRCEAAWELMYKIEAVLSNWGTVSDDITRGLGKDQDRITEYADEG